MCVTCPYLAATGSPAGRRAVILVRMHISAKADYAVRALRELARDQGRPLTCESIASSQEIPFRFLKSVVGDLRRAGLVRSQRGCEGGYWLGRGAAEINLLEIAVAVDGELMTLRGDPLLGLDYPGPAAGLPGVWRSIEDGARRSWPGRPSPRCSPSGPRCDRRHGRTEPELRARSRRAGGPDADSDVEVVEYTDPLCPWASGSEPAVRWLRAVLGGRGTWRRAYAILFDSDDDPAPDPAAEAAWYARDIAEVSGHTGAPHAERLDRAALSSWPASLAARAAEAPGRRGGPAGAEPPDPTARETSRRTTAGPHTPGHPAHSGRPSFLPGPRPCCRQPSRPSWPCVNRPRPNASPSATSRTW